MPIRLEDSREFLEDGVEQVGKRAKKFWQGFSSFAVQDNVLEVAVGLMYVYLCLNTLFTVLSSPNEHITRYL